MKTAKKLYFCRRVRIAGDNPRILWDALKEITNLKKKTESIGTIRFNEQLINDDSLKANIFNDYFADVGINTIKDLPTSEKSFEDYMPPPIEDSLEIDNISPQEMKNFIKAIKAKNSQDINEISGRFLGPS